MDDDDEPEVQFNDPADKAAYEQVMDLIRILEDFAEDYPDRESIMTLLHKREDTLFSLRA